MRDISFEIPHTDGKYLLELLDGRTTLIVFLDTKYYPIPTKK